MGTVSRQSPRRHRREMGELSERGRGVVVPVLRCAAGGDGPGLGRGRLVGVVPRRPAMSKPLREQFADGDRPGWYEYDYEAYRELGRGWSFASLIMAAYYKADSVNAAKLGR